MKRFLFKSVLRSVGAGLLICFLAVGSINAAVITANAVTGNWSATGSWVGGVVPISTDDIIVPTGATITVDVPVTISASLKTTGGTITGGANLTISGIYEHAMNAGSIPTATWSDGSTLKITGMTSTLPSGMGTPSFYNIIYDCPNSTATAPNFGFAPATSNVGSQTIRGDVTIINIGTGNTHIMRFTSVAANDVKTITINGNLTIAPTTTLATFQTTGSGQSSALITVNVKGNLTIAGGNNGPASYNFGASSTPCTLNLEGDLILSGTSTTNKGTLAKGSGLGTFNFSKPSGTQTFTRGANTEITCTTLAFNVKSGSTLDLGTSILRNETVAGSSSGAATFTVEAGAGLKVGDAVGITSSGATGNVQVSGARTFTAGSNYEYTGSAAGAVTGNGLPATVNNLTISNSSGVKLSNAATTVSGALTLGANTLDVNGKSLTIAGTLSRTSGSLLASGASSTVVVTGLSSLPTGLFSGATLTNLTISNPTSVALTEGLAVTGALSLTTGKLTMGTNVISGAGSFTVASGTTLECGHTGGIAGNNTTSGAQSLSTGANYTFNGSSAQITSAALPATVNNLTINNSAGVTLSATTTASGALTLTSGNLTLSANNLTVGSTTGGSASSHVITDGTGTLSVNCPMSSTTNFPIGATASTYDPVTLNPASTSVVAVKVKATASAADFSGTGGNQITDVSKVAPREWNITPVTPSVTTMALTNGGTTFTPTTALLGHFKLDNTWEAIAATYSSNTWTASVSSFSPFGGGDVGGFVVALSIELAKFTAKADGTVNNIAWSTVSEKNNHTFQIERSANGLTFTNIGTVKGSGTTNVGRDYNFTDEGPLPSSSGSAISINYYRLRSVDFDGKSEVSNVVTVFRSTSGKLKVYPNVTSDKLTVSTDSPDGQTYILTNLLGATVQVGQLTGQKEVFVSNLSAGTYLLKVGSEVVRFVKN